MGFTITTIKEFDKNNYKKIGKIGKFIINFFLKELINCNQLENFTKKDFYDFIDIKNPFIGDIEFFAYKDQNGNIYFEYISGQEIYNGNEEVNYISLLPFNDPRFQQKIEIILNDIKENNCSIESIKKGLLDIKEFLTKELVIEYTNDTIFGSTDITGYEGQGKGYKAEYIKEKDLFKILKDFSENLSNKKNVDSEIIYNFLRNLVLDIFIGKQKQKDNKIEQQITDIINNNLDLLKNKIKKDLYLIEYEELEQINDIENLIKFLVIDDSEYISGLICHECSAINYDFDINDNSIRFICKGCGKENNKSL